MPIQWDFEILKTAIQFFRGYLQRKNKEKICDRLRKNRKSDLKIDALAFSRLRTCYIATLVYIEPS